MVVFEYFICKWGEIDCLYIYLIVLVVIFLIDVDGKFVEVVIIIDE